MLSFSPCIDDDDDDDDDDDADVCQNNNLLGVQNMNKATCFQPCWISPYLLQMALLIHQFCLGAAL